jgi:DNA helicase-2/ATP-dependent DNA helicase PcrA
MPVEKQNVKKLIEITLEHIREAESKLLEKGKSFHDNKNERISFIQNLSTCDLLAVPGSGKTTALLAKLYCLEKHLPFEDCSGILVLAHTNAAVDEIKEKLQLLCPKLFQYPNFIGTIQSFVNQFLANPANLIKHESNLWKIDNDYYSNQSKMFFNKLKWSKQNEPKKLKNKIYGVANINKNDLTTQEKTKNSIDFIYNLDFDFINNKIIYGDKNTSFRTHNSKNQDAKNEYLELESWKKELLGKGIAKYSDAYYLADWYIYTYNSIKKILCNRFSYVFVDEMQDLQHHQIKIIDDIFFVKGSKTIIQRIGDKNQSIYNSGKRVNVECVWETRESTDSKQFKDLIITGSNRLTKDVAEIVNYLVLDRNPDNYKVEGLRELKEIIPPHLIVFNPNKKEKLLEKFKEVIKGYQDKNIIPKKIQGGSKLNFNVIAWSGEWGEERTDANKGKIRLEDIVAFSKEEKSKKEDFDTLSKHIQFYDKERKTLESIRKSILNALIQILRIEEKKYQTCFRGKIIEKYYSKSNLLSFIKESKNNGYEDFKQNLFNWCWFVKIGKEKEAYESIKEFIHSNLKQWFDLKLSPEVLEFIGKDFLFVDLYYKAPIKTGNDNEIMLKVGTVHSVKGQTHCATLYIETSYYNYETEKIVAPLYKENHECILGQKDAKGKEKDQRKKQALKMMYVGFSRPTHLLCFAALEENVKEHLDKFKSAGWEINKDLI